MSIDGIGAFDLISRNAMLEGLFRMVPFCEMFLREPVHIFVEGRDGRHPTHLTRGGRGAGRPPHAHAVRIGAAWFPRLHSREVETTSTSLRTNRHELRTCMGLSMKSSCPTRTSSCINRGGLEPEGCESCET